MKPFYKGKVRDVYDLGDRFLLSSSDRVSAFDCVFSEPIPEKGKVLNQISNLWFSFFKDIPNHIQETDWNKFPSEFRTEEFKGRSVIVKKCRRIDFECVVRGYLTGSGYKEYKEKGTLADCPLPSGIQESEKLTEPAFTPALKNDTGHDENISEQKMESIIGKEIFSYLKETSIRIYSKAAEKMLSAGIILCDTKFEFGFDGDKILLIDELLTPDSSRYWALDTYKKGSSPPSYDKQILRNYLESTDWNKEPPPPSLPPEIIQTLHLKYKELQRKLEICLSEK